MKNMEELELEGEGLLASAFCHEIDHLCTESMYVELCRRTELHDVEPRQMQRRKKSKHESNIYGNTGFFGGNTGSAD